MIIYLFELICLVSGRPDSEYLDINISFTYEGLQLA